VQKPQDKVNPAGKRTIRSYVLRTGRMTAAQQQGYDSGWHQWGLSYQSGPLDIPETFERLAPVVLEIGFGMGQSILAMAKATPDCNFIGIEVHTPGIGKLMSGMKEQAVDNLRIYHHDAVEVLRDCIPENSLDTVQIFFPDPWHKRKHHKRRLIQAIFVELLRTRLKPGGLLHLATDWENYAGQMMAVLSGTDTYKNSYGEGQYAPRPEHRPYTKFEKRGERLGHGVWDLMFTRVR